MLDKIMILFLVAMNSIAIAFLYFSFKFHIENFKESLGLNREIREANHNYLLERIRRIENDIKDIKDSMENPSSKEVRLGNVYVEPQAMQGKPMMSCCTEYLEEKK
jgi:hypothetical protein